MAATSNLLLGGRNLLLPSPYIYNQSLSASSNPSSSCTHLPIFVLAEIPTLDFNPIKMKKKCNLELCLVPAGIDESEQDNNERGKQPEHDQEREMRGQMTIFYGGKVCVCDVTEMKARAILCSAWREMEEKLATTPERSLSSSRPVSPIPLPSPQVYGTDNGMSMKKSLQRFLQKRKTRIEAASPYSIGQSRRNGVVKSFVCLKD